MRPLATADEMREGPTWTDERGELSYEYLSCRTCNWLRINDGHYFYCRDLGDKSKPDFTSVYSGGMKRLHNFPRPDSACRLLDGVDPEAIRPKAQSTQTTETK